MLAVPAQAAIPTLVPPSEISLFSAGTSSQPRTNSQTAGPSSMPPAAASPSNRYSSPIRVDDDDDAEFLRRMGFDTEQAGPPYGTSIPNDAEDDTYSEVDAFFDRILAERKRAEFPEDYLDPFDNFEFQF